MGSHFNEGPKEQKYVGWPRARGTVQPPGPDDGATTRRRPPGKKRRGTEAMKVMISLAGEEREGIGRPMRKALMDRGIEAWLDDEEIPAGGNIVRRVQEALMGCDKVVMIISENYARKEWPMREAETLIGAGRDREEDLIPVLVGLTHEQAATLMPWIAPLKSVAWSGNAERIAEEVARAGGITGGKRQGRERTRGRQVKKRKRLGPMNTREATALSTEALKAAAEEFEQRSKILGETYQDVEVTIEWRGSDGFDATIWVNGEPKRVGGFWLGGLHAITPGITYNDGGCGGRNSANGQLRVAPHGSGNGFKEEWSEDLGWGGPPAVPGEGFTETAIRKMWNLLTQGDVDMMEMNRNQGW